MSKIYAFGHLDKKTWEITTVSLRPETTVLHIGFKDNKDVIAFDNLKFGYILKHNQEIIKESGFPPAGVTYLQTDKHQLFLEVDTIDLQSSTTYDITFWLENNNERFENSFQIDL